MALQCPTTFLILAPEEASQPGQVARALKPERVALVASSGSGALLEWGSVCAEQLGVPTRRAGGLGTVEAGEGDGAAAGTPPDTTDRIAGFTEVLADIADEFRGETVLVVTEAELIRTAVPVLAANLHADHADTHRLDLSSPVRVEAGDDGWWCRAWPQAPDAAGN